jgi:MFS family permease
VRAPSLNPFAVLQRHPNFRRFWYGQTLSLVGSWMHTMARGWLALELTHDAFLVGLVAAAQSLPVVLFSLHAGAMVDRSDKLRLVTIAQLLLSVEAAVLWWLTSTGAATIGWLLALATFTGIVQAAEVPARQSLQIELVGREDLRSAIALNSSGFNLARIVGPMIGAIIIARFGITWCFGVNALSYVAVLAGLFLVRLPAPHPVASSASAGEGVRQGLAYMRDTPAVSALMRIVTVFSVLGAPYLTLMPVMARDELGMGAGGYGLLLTCVGVGGLVAALTLAALGERVPRGRMLAWTSFGYPTLLVLFAAVRGPVLAYPLLLLVGFAMVVNGALSNAILQHLVPDTMRGRMMAAYSLVVVGLSSVVGAFSGGAVARAVGVRWAVGGAAAAMLAYAAWAYRRGPELARL